MRRGRTVQIKRSSATA